MRIIHATDLIVIPHGRMVIIGPHGIGKTTLANTADEPLNLDFDQGTHRAQNRRDTLAINGWPDVLELMEKPEALSPYKTILLDTVGRCLDLMTVDILQNNPKLGHDGNLSQHGWGVLKGRFRTWTTQLATLGKDLVMIAHEKEDKDGDVRLLRADIQGGSYSEVMKITDFIGYVYMQGKERILDFSPTEQRAGKNPAGWNPIRVPHFAKEPNFLGALLKEGRDALGRISSESEGIASVIADWRSAVEAFASADECGRSLAEIEALPAIAKAQVKAILWERVKALGLTWDGKAFVAKPKEGPKQKPAGAAA